MVSGQKTRCNASFQNGLCLFGLVSSISTIDAKGMMLVESDGMTAAVMHMQAFQ